MASSFMPMDRKAVNAVNVKEVESLRVKLPHNNMADIALKNRSIVDLDMNSSRAREATNEFLKQFDGILPHQIRMRSESKQGGKTKLMRLSCDSLFGAEFKALKRIPYNTKEEEEAAASTLRLQFNHLLDRTLRMSAAWKSYNPNRHTFFKKSTDLLALPQSSTSGNSYDCLLSAKQKNATAKPHIGMKRKETHEKGNVKSFRKKLSSTHASRK